MSGPEDLGFATLDLGRERRQGVAEVVYGPGKRPEEITAIVTTLLGSSTGPVLVTRVGEEVAGQISVPGGVYDRRGRVLAWRPADPGERRVAVVTAGTSDAPVAAEAAVVARALGMRVDEIRDVGVAGLHRVLSRVDSLRQADVVIVVAGMEGALASVVAGLVGAPVVAVPTSTGYGAALDGVTALLAMMTSCAAGVCVVNIDSGFSAAMVAHRFAFAMNGGRP